MKKLFLLYTFFILNQTYSQNDDRFRFYKLDGTEYLITEKEPITIKYFEEHYISEYKYTHAHTNFDLYNKETKTGILAIYYIEFTDKPLYILGNKPTQYEIKIALSTFISEDYLKKWQFDYNLKKYIKEGNLIIDDLYKIFGKPNKKIETSLITILEYTSLKLNFTIKDYKVIDFLHYN